MAALLSNSRGSSATTTGSTWASTTNAYDGTYGTNTNTYATLTAAASGSTSTIKVSGYNFSSLFPSGARINSITVTARGLVTTANRWSAPTIQAYVGATALGSAVATTAWTNTVASYSVKLTGITVANLQDPTFSIQLNLVRAGGSTDGASVDFLDVSVDYSTVSWGSLSL